MSTCCNESHHKQGGQNTTQRLQSDLPVLVEGLSIVTVASVFVHITSWAVLRNTEAGQSVRTMLRTKTPPTWKGS